MIGMAALTPDAAPVATVPTPATTGVTTVAATCAVAPAFPIARLPVANAD